MNWEAGAIRIKGAGGPIDCGFADARCAELSAGKDGGGSLSSSSSSELLWLSSEKDGIGAPLASADDAFGVVSGDDEL